jgi:hypothetical protein
VTVKEQWSPVTRIAVLLVLGLAFWGALIALMMFAR